MKDYRLSRKAARDVVDVCKHIATDNATAARDFAARLHARLKLLARFPESGERLIDSGGRQYRRVSFGNYVIYFRGGGEKLEIVRLVHGAQQNVELDK
jgi:toxin ParE1/3/4